MADSPVNVVVQAGGKLIGQGAYGCIFSPPLTCRGETKPRRGWKTKKLGKMTEISDIKNEITASKVLGRFPDAKNYCILPEIDTLCKPAPMSQQREKDLKDCEALEKYGTESMMEYELDFGGKTLKTRIQMTDFTTTFPFFRFMGDMLEIGAFLVLHGCIHNDLHGNNIVMKNDFRPRLIDFGRSYIYSSINKATVEELTGVQYDAGLGQIPPEITAHHGIHNGIPFKTILADIYTKKPGLLAAERVLGLSRREQLADFRDFWLTSKSIHDDDWVTFYKLYWPVVDSWSIGHNLVGILKRLLLSRKFVESDEWIKKQGVIKDVLKGLLQASPKKRLDAVEALAIYDPMNDVVSSVSGRAWLDAKR